VQRSVVSRSCNHCCNGTATVCSLCIVNRHVAVSSVKTVECCHGNTRMCHMLYCRAAKHLRNLRLSPRLNWILPYSGLLGGVWQFKNWCFCATYRFHVQGSSCPRRRRVVPLNMGATGNAETSVSNHLTPRNNPEDGSIQTLLCSYVKCPILTKFGFLYGFSLKSPLSKSVHRQ
jgi:hypothetical protein